MNNHERLLYLFDRLPADQQQDLMNLLEIWNNMPIRSEEANDTALNPALEAQLGKEWHCLNVLKRTVHTHFPPRLELAYVAFHPDLDSVSSAKSRPAAEQMYALEAAYELKRILAEDPDSDVLSEEVKKHIHDALYKETT